MWRAVHHGVCGVLRCVLCCPLCCPQCCPRIVLCCPCVASASPLYCPLCPCVALASPLNEPCVALVLTSGALGLPPASPLYQPCVVLVLSAVLSAVLPTVLPLSSPCGALMLSRCHRCTHWPCKESTGCNQKSNKNLCFFNVLRSKWIYRKSLNCSAWTQTLLKNSIKFNTFAQNPNSLTISEGPF